MSMVSWWASDGYDQIPSAHLLRCDPGLAQLAFLMEMDENDVSAVGSLQIADVRGHSQIDSRDLDVDPPASFTSEMALPLRILPGACPYMQTADTVFASDASALQLVVSLDAPFRIHDATIAFFDMFQLSASSCIGRSLGLVQGPETNVKLLSSIFETARVGKEANAMLMFYSSSGDGHLFRVSLQTQSSIGTLSMHRNSEDLETQRSCIVSLELVQATPLKDALLPDGRAKVIVSADRSATVHVSPEFEKMYGYLWSEIEGRTLGFITGPNTNMALLRKLLNSARDGRSEAALFLTNARAGQEILTVIQVNPVVDAGVVTQVVVFFSIIDIDGHAQSSFRGLCLYPTHDNEWVEDKLDTVRRLQELHPCVQYASTACSQQSTVQDASNGSRSGDASPHSEDVEIEWAKSFHTASQFHFSPFSHQSARKQESLIFLL